MVVEVNTAKYSGKVTLTQVVLTKKVLNTAVILDINNNITPAATIILVTDADGPPFGEPWEYAYVVWILIYLSRNSRPDIHFEVHQCSRFIHSPRISHSEAVNIICLYLVITQGQGLTFNPNSEMKLDLYVDADFSGFCKREYDQDPVCINSINGYVMALVGFPFYWVSNMYTDNDLSTLDAEYISLFQDIHDLLTLRRFIQEVGTQLNMGFAYPTIIHSAVFEDKNGSLCFSKSPSTTQRKLHISVKCHFFR